MWGFLTDPHPSVQEIGEQRRAQLLASLTLILVFTLILAVLASRGRATSFAGYLIIALLAYTLSRTTLYRAGAYFFTFAFTSIGYLSIRFGNATSIDSVIYSIVPISLIFASALLSSRGFAALSIVTVIATLSVTSYADPKYLDDPNLNLTRIAGIIFSTALILLGVTVFRVRTENERIKQIREANLELEKLTGDLEQRVANRTSELKQVNETTTRRATQLQTIAELSQTIAQVQNPNEIFSVAANLISERFGYYHIGIFLIDREREFAVLQAANSAGGQRMLARGHRLALGTGVVGFAAQTRKPRIALDVGQDAVFFNNPDLPETRSEIALPLMYNEQSIGVLDVQSKEAGAFSEEDFRVLGTLANQLAIAIENTRLLAEARAATKQMQEVYNEFVRTQWKNTSQKMEYAGYRYNAGRIELLESPENGEVKPEASTSNLTEEADRPSEETREKVAIPVRLRGEVIGMLNVESNDPSKTWKQDELRLMEAVAERAALALENARLFQDARRRAAKERMIAEATSHISASLNIENILEATAAELERALGGSEVLIQFDSKDSA